MATWFELHLVTDDTAYAGQAAVEAFALVDRLEALLSRYREDSEISQINRLAPEKHLRLSAETFACLRLALDLRAETGDAFDPTLGHLGRLVLFPEEHIVLCEDGPVHLDLGAIGKGFALDLVAEHLREWELPRALLVAGGSSLLALDSPSDGTDWELTLTKRQSIWITNAAIGASGAAVKGAHILDPRNGEPCQRHARTWACASSAAAADALSTAWMLLDREEIETVCTRRPETGGALLASETHPEAIECFGGFPQPVYNSAK